MNASAGCLAVVMGMLVVLACNSGCSKCNDQACPAGEKVGRSLSEAKETVQSFGESVGKGYKDREEERAR